MINEIDKRIDELMDMRKALDHKINYRIILSESLNNNVKSLLEFLDFYELEQLGEVVKASVTNSMQLDRKLSEEIESLWDYKHKIILKKIFPNLEEKMQVLSK